MRSIVSLQHPLVKHLVKLRQNKDYRQEQGQVLIVGDKLIAEQAPVQLLLTTAQSPAIQADEVISITPEILKKITGLQQPESMAAVVPLPPPADLRGKTWILVLDQINDPGNLGTLLRTALALGWEGVFITENSVDPYNEKALRAAKGATFFLPIAYGSWEDLKHWHLYAADMDGTPFEQAHIQTPLALVLGNEAHGISRPIQHKLSIPMNGQSESLNVAIAGGILLHALRKR